MINLLPLEEKKKVRGEYLARLTIAGLYFLAATLLIGMVLLLSFYVSLRSKGTIARDQLDAFTLTEESNAKGYEEIIKETNKKLAVLQADDAKERVYDQVINTIISHRGDIRITGVVYEKTKNGTILVRLAGVSPDRESLLAFTKVIEQKSPFSNVTVPVSNFVKERDIEFSMEITVGAQ